MTEYALTLTEMAVNAAVKGVMSLICRVDVEQLSRVPSRGPLILVTNHINFLEVPIMYTHLQPSPVVGFAKAETWDSPFLGPLFTLWNAIPVHRGEADLTAIRLALGVLKKGHILAISPEGTRSGHGRLQKGYAGVVTLALRSGAPILPIVNFGGEQYRNNLSRLRRTDFKVIVGEPFMLDTGGAKTTSGVRGQMTDEIMYQLASLLPPAYRGEYADLSKATQNYLKFITLN
ncbi:MAG: 1-acyl-sn-glycerol-3-phosphate acyltransferase [Anaerolineales bacterium]|nr:1-acyl-sn-glycerol-3-phosphate acyltransferase [Chloroflexota bacterium]MBL7163862.1 1-acyl-sn-glycerol-3-phosphate acyltransferase [Anaerolineales bacterium]